MANVTGQSAKEVSDQMTAVWNNFAKGNKDLESFADKMVELGAATASSSDEIATGLEKFASIGETVGLSFDYAAAALATVTAETRQTADTVGTSFKTLFSRMEGLKLGETLDDGTDLNKYSKALETVGVNIKTASGELRSMDNILDDLGNRWKSLDAATQTALAQTVGGARQYTQLIALMNNWDTFKQNLAIEANSAGELGAQADIYAESWEGAKKRVQASLEDIYADIVDDKVFIKMNNGFADTLNVIDDVIEGMGGIKTILIGLTGVFMNMIGSKINPALETLKQNFLILTGQGQKAYQNIANQMNEAIAVNTASISDPAEQQKLANSQQLLVLKTKIQFDSFLN